MKRAVCLLLAVLCFALAGCQGWTNGSYVSIKPHQEQNDKTSPENVSASVCWQLRNALTDLVESGAEEGIIYVHDYDQGRLESDLKTAIHHATTENPVGAYAVEGIRYELGTSSGMSAVAVEITYLHDRAAIRRIKQYETMDEVHSAITQALAECQAGLVIQIHNYENADFPQLIQDYAEAHPQVVMEIPEVSVGMYPEKGSDRVVELKFTYQTSREVLRSMQTQVKPIFNSAELYVRGDGEEQEKLSQLYSFLMERFDYKIETSITPAYSLLRHGVGDCKAFALVYAAMCKNAELECLVVSGTRAGEAWYWNIVRVGEDYYHVDLLASAAQNEFQTLTDSEMEGYVWDYSAYPICGEQIEPPEPTDPTTQTMPEENSN